MRSLSRKTGHRNHLLRNLATSLILFESLETTEAKAKEIKSVLDHLLAKAFTTDSLTARRFLKSYLFDSAAERKVMEVYRPNAGDLRSGFVKSIRLKPRLGDSSAMMRLTLKPELTKVVSTSKVENTPSKEDK